MKIPQINNIINRSILKTLRVGFVASLALFPVQKTYSPEKVLTEDVFEHEILVKPISKAQTLKDLPKVNPNINVAGELKKATLVVDTDKNKLYHFDQEGNIIKEYNVATGKTSTPTDKGLRMVTWIENYPYSSAPAMSKRRKAPRDYGPKIIVIGVVDKKTGEVTHFNGEFIHGTNRPQSIGTHASKGCVRMNNEDVKELAAQMEKGMYVKIK